MRLPQLSVMSHRNDREPSTRKGIEPQGCPPGKKVFCAVAVAACAGVCVYTGGAACAACFAGLGMGPCIDCA